MNLDLNADVGEGADDEPLNHDQLRTAALEADAIISVLTDQIGESRLDKNVKKFFVELHRTADPTHAIEAGY